MYNNKSWIVVTFISVIITGLLGLWAYKMLSNSNGNNSEEEKVDDKSGIELMDQYKQAKINTFQNETKNIYRIAQQQFLIDSLLLNNDDKLVFSNDCTIISGIDVVKELEMSGSPKMKYYILIDSLGKILEIKTTNGEFSYSLDGSDIRIEDIDVEKNNKVILESLFSSGLCPESIK